MRKKGENRDTKKKWKETKGRNEEEETTEKENMENKEIVKGVLEL